MDQSGTLSQSTDGGETWAPLLDLKQALGIREIEQVDLQVVGGQGVAPGRLYLVHAGHTLDVRSSALFRSDDDGATWSQVALLDSGPGDPAEAYTDVGSLAYDPANPDRVYVAVSIRNGPDVFRSGVRASSDGGQTWTELGRQDMPTITDLKLGIDGRNLYAATPKAVYQLRLVPQE
jgi:photosystem II stability/assembly factor-like uncharacterized protein